MITTSVQSSHSQQGANHQKRKHSGGGDKNAGNKPKPRAHLVGGSYHAASKATLSRYKRAPMPLNTLEPPVHARPCAPKSHSPVPTQCATPPPRRQAAASGPPAPLSRRRPRPRLGTPSRKRWAQTLRREPSPAWLGDSRWSPPCAAIKPS